MQPDDPPKPNISLSALQDLAVRRRVVLAWLALAWERLWSRLWVTGALVGVFVAIVLMDILPRLPLVAHLLLLLAGACGIAFVAWRHLQGFAWPTRMEARVRLETLSPVTHRPLTAVEDSLAPGSNPIQQMLWRLHQARAQGDITRLRAAPPAPGIAIRDRFATRAVVVLVLFVAFAGAWGNVESRLFRGFLPFLGDDASNAQVKLWITPPAYTNRSPVYVELPAPNGATLPNTLDIAAGSKALVMVTGAARDATLALDDDTFRLDRLADQSQRGEMELTKTDRLEVRSGSRTVIGWDVNWIQDAPPTVALVNTPTAGVRWRFRIDYSAQDDYGLQALTARIWPADKDAKTVEPIEVPIQLPPFSPKSAEQTSLNDLTALPWAGTRVNVQLTVTDVAGLSGSSETVEANLPERVFVHPVARELARVRKGLFSPFPGAQQVALESVSRILTDPQSFGGDPLVHLALSTTKYRLAEETRDEVARSTPELLWSSAIRIEDGNVAVAEQRLLTAEQALREAIESGAAQSEIDRLVAELQQAVQEYQQAVNEKGGQQSNFSAKQDNSQRTTDIAQLAEQLRQLSEMGSSDDAKRAFAELQAELDELRNAAMNNQQNSQQVQAAERMLQEMREIAKQQSAMLDKNFKEAQRDSQNGAGQQQQSPSQQGNQQQAGAQQGQQQPGNSASRQAADQQAAVRQQLESLMQQMQQMTGQRSEGLQESEGAMRQAEGALRAGSWKQGVDQQGRALSSLEEGMAEAARQMAEYLFEEGMGGLAQLEMGRIRYKQQGGQGRSGGDEVEGGVPRDPDTAGTAERVRAILDEIRNRAADRTRPAAEQEYLRRLMKPF